MELVRGNSWIKALAALAAINVCEASSMTLGSYEVEQDQPTDAQATSAATAGLGMESPPADQTGSPTDAQGYGYRIRLDSGASAIIPSLQSQEGTETKTIFATDGRGATLEKLVQLLCIAQKLWQRDESGRVYSQEEWRNIIQIGIAGMSGGGDLPS